MFNKNIFFFADFFMHILTFFSAYLIVFWCIKFTALNIIHGLSHPGVKATTKLIKAKFVWASVNKDVAFWVKFGLSKT